MGPGRWVQVISVLVVLGAVAAIGPLQASINRSRAELELTPSDDPLKAMPHDVALSLAALGSFRGLAVDYLWLRADRLKAEGKHYEALQLADMICKLQPRFPTVWAFQAWNMAWNISVTTHTPEERWLWVRNGMRLLRDRGIPLNPHAHLLYRELAWLFLNKMGQMFDDMHMVYKRNWSFLMHRLLEAPPPGASTEELIARLEPIAAAPNSLDAFLSAHPEAATLVDHLSVLGVDMTVDYPAGAEHHPLEETFFNPYMRLASAEAIDRESLALSATTDAGERDVKLLELFSDPNNAEPMGVLLPFLRRKVLLERYKLDPERMIADMKLFGPLDWRSCAPHAIYWVMRGEEMLRKRSRATLPMWQLLNTRRFVFFALKDLFYYGRIVFEPNMGTPYRSQLFTLPDLRFIDIAHETYVTMFKDEDPNAQENRAADLYQLGHGNMLSDGIKQLYIDGQHEMAAYYYKYLHDNIKERDGRTKRVYQQPLEDFVMRDYLERLTSRNMVMPVVYEMLTRAYEELSLDNYNGYANRRQWAVAIYNHYMDDKVDDLTDRRQLPPFDEMATRALYLYIVAGRLPDSYKANLWRSAALPARQAVYDDLRPELIKVAARNNWDIDKAFAEPEGMAAYRMAHPQMGSRAKEPELIVPKLGL